MSIRSARLAVSLAIASIVAAGEGGSPLFAQPRTATASAAAPAGEPATNEAAEKLKPEERIRRALQSPTELDLQETPLDEVVNLIRENHKIEVQIDKKALDDVGIAPDTLITKDLKRVSLRSALRLMLHELDLTYMIRDEVLLITTPEVYDQQLTTTVYDVADLVVPDENRDARPDFKALTDLVTAAVRPTSWGAVGGPGAVSRFGGGGIRALVVSQTQESHEEVVDLLSLLRAIRPAPAGKGPPAVGRILPEPAAAEKAIRRALQQPTDIEVFEKPLDEVVDLLREKHKIEIQLDKKALDDVGIATDTLVTKSLKGISLRSGLNLMLRELDLTYMIQDEVLLITTPEVADRYLQTKVYDVADLMEGKAVAACMEQLSDAITSCVRPSRWDAAGGPGVLCSFTNAGIRALVVSETQEVHEEIADLLGQLRQLRRGRPAEAGPVVAKPATKPLEVPDEQPAGLKPAADMLPRLSRGDRAIADSLERPISLKFKDASLEEVVAELNKKTGVFVLLDKKAIAADAAVPGDDEGFMPRKPKPPLAERKVSLQVAEVKLRSALRLLLDPVDLAWTVKEGRLLITTAEVADQNLHTRTYDVSDLPSFRNERGQGVPDYKALMGAIASSVDERSWDVNDGIGSVRPVDANSVQALVVSQTWQNHEGVASLLTDLRKNRKRPLTKAEIEKLLPMPPPDKKCAE